ncbi:helix-turn-helix domain-containing protein [Pseudopedobacter beijingensis]|uniref:Helix-turn-helix domain-containing protein n=1 Tax=Pseudopedobacter beijingensis TaxID=1207056 RepID=A0ABW4IHK0_9SPHI
MFYKPHPALEPYIQGFVVVYATDAHVLYNIDLFPVGYGLLSFILSEQHQLISLNRSYNTRFNFTGQLDHYRLIKASSLSVIYVLFKPFGAYKLLGVPQHLLKNESIAMQDILGNAVNEVYAKLVDHADNPAKEVEILQEWLLSQLRDNNKIDTNRVSLACDLITESKGNISIQELNSLCCMSKSSMEQYFKDQIGVSPKMYSRIIRFNETKKILKEATNKSWIEIVENHGYYDQSHFIHEFKHFFGYSPSQIHLSFKNLAEHISSIKSV